MRRILAIALGAAAVLVASARAQVAPSSPPQARSRPPAPSLVRIDAVVTDARGRAVRDLKAADFSILEDGREEPVESATFVSADGGGAAVAEAAPIATRADEQREAARPGARLFAIFLDEYHVANGAETERARELVSQLVERNFGPRDLALVVKPLDSLLSLRLTHDRAALLDAVSTFEGREGDYTPRNEFEQNYFAVTPDRIEVLRSQVVTSALNALASHIGRLQSGRKTLLIVSRGFAPAPRRREEALPTIESVTRAANRMGVSIYAIDPGALLDGAPQPAAPAQGAGADTDSRQVLRTLTADTDGKAALAASDVATVVTRITADASGYYELSFRPGHPDDARTFHPVGVRVAGPKLAVHARGGYWSLSADDLMRERTELRASIPTPPPQPMRHTSPLIHPWFGLSKPDSSAANSGQLQVSFVWEPVPPVPGDRVRRGPPALISVKASRVTDGAVVFTGNVRPTTAPDGGGDAPPEEVTFDSPPGRLLVQLAIQDADAHVLDTDVRDVVVGALAGPVEVGTPRVLRAENARVFRTLEADPDAVPVATRDFSRDDHLLFRLPVYAGTAPVAVTAALASKAGGVMRDLPVAPMADARQYQVDLPLAGLVVGEYSVEITARSADGDATETVTFRVVP